MAWHSTCLEGCGEVVVVDAVAPDRADEDQKVIVPVDEWISRQDFGSSCKARTRRIDGYRTAIPDVQGSEGEDAQDGSGDDADRAGRWSTASWSSMLLHSLFLSHSVLTERHLVSPQQGVRARTLC